MLLEAICKILILCTKSANTNMKFSLFFLLILFCVSLNAQSIVGAWKTIDDNTGEPRAVVEIYERDGLYFGKITKTFPQEGEDDDPICEKCPGKLKNEKIIGMEIITDMKEKKDGTYQDGEILDAETGKVYDCKLWVEDGNLRVRGYLLFLYRTQTWLPYQA